MALQILTDSEFERKFYSKIDRIETSLNDLSQKLKVEKPEEFLTRTEVSKLLKITVTTLDRWTVQGQLTRYGIGKKIYYKRSEIETSLVEIHSSKSH